MNCPRCGLAVVGDQRFCRGCGTELATGLEPIVDTGVGNHGAFLRLQRAAGVGSSIEAPSRSAYFMGGMAIFLGGTALSAAGGILFHSDTVVFAGILMMLIGMFLIAYSSIMGPRRRRPVMADPAADSTEDVMFRAETTRQLVSPVESDGFGSVTEGTTDLLKVEKGRMKDEE